MPDPAVRFSVSDAIGLLTLNRPDHRNSLAPELLNAVLAAALRNLRCLEQ